ncbi:MAG: hypothetical protein ACERKD_22090 [Prolixibacteraceae bacterium]
MEFGTVLIIVGVISLFILEAFFEVAIFSLLGAAVRWMFYRNEKKFSQLFQAKTKTNYIVGILSFLVILAIPLAGFAIINN